MKAYKGFDKNLQCLGYRYEIGRTFEEDDASLYSKGFHACEYPLDCFSYYTPADSRYCEVEIEDNGERNSEDTKVCGKKIRIGAEVGIKELIFAASAYVKAHCTNTEQGQDRCCLTGGDRSALTGGNSSALTGGDKSALTGGYKSALNGGYKSALNGGDWSALTGGYKSALNGGDWSALTGGDRSALNGGNWSALNGGDRSALTGGDKSALTGGDWSALTGGDRSALTSGYKSALTGGDSSALTGGDWSVVYGGENAKVRAGIGSVLALQYWVDGEFFGVKCEAVDGKKIKANTWYRLDKAGRFIEARE